MNFEENFDQMGLIERGNGCYFYEDQYSQVAYNKIQTNPNSEILNDIEIPYLAIFTRKDDTTDFVYRSIVSSSYQFIGNDSLNQQLRNSINDVGSPILTEKNLLNYTLTSMHNQIIISNCHNVPEQGDIYPEIVIKNTYNGTGAANISFGLHMDNFGFGNVSFGFGFKNKISDMRQIHLLNSQTSLSTAIGGYVNVFSENIADLINENFDLEVNEEELLSTLDLVEKIGKKKRDEVSSYIEELSINNEPLTAWKLFLAITRFSSVEKNLNAKNLIENIAERVLVVPEQMINAMTEINRTA